eukprot:TRINITY_DN22216_c0_g1_i1.p1 TRINITY_DN22216_c0_g1~~TRINITY_DN22216_c0_g1_i1.p1  ORF type:complete len:261 (+),score=49.23 TRINITY_DN22216_c0_g1_i1:81-863(+)
MCEAVASRGDTLAEEDSTLEPDGLVKYSWRHGLTLLSDPRHALTCGTGVSLWSSGEILADYLAEHPEIYAGSADAGPCLELGAGLGAAGLTMARCGARCVVLTDIERQIPLLRRNAAANFPSVDELAVGDDSGPEVRVQPLDFSIEEQRRGLEPWRQRWAAIVGADVGYDYDLFRPILDTLLAQSSRSTTILLALADREEYEEPNVEDFVYVSSPYFDCEEVHCRRLEAHQSLTKILRLTRKVDLTALPGSPRGDHTGKQ